MRRKLSLLLVIIMLLAVIPPQNADASIRISNTGAVVPVGMAKRLFVGGVSGKPTWTSSNKSVATVSSAGVVTGRKVGNCQITAKASGQTIKCNIKVINRYSAWQVGNVVLTRVKKYYPKAHLLEYSRSGSRILLDIHRPAGDGAPGRELTVNINTGKATWEYEWNDFFGKMPRSFDVWVCTSVKAATTKVVLNKTAASVVKGKTITLKATVTPSSASSKGVKWSSSNTKVATVSSKGVVRGVAFGTATITAAARDGSGKKATCKVTVKKASVPNVTDTVLRKKPADVAKYLGLTQKRRYYNSDYEYYEYYYIRKGRKLFDAGPRLQYLNGTFANYNGYWDLVIKDSSVAFQGVRVGMSVSKAKSLLSKKWKLDASYSDMLCFERDMNYSFTWGDGVDLLVYIKSGKVKAMKYLTIESE